MAQKTKQLKKWNGRDGQGGTYYIAAYSQKQAAELYTIASRHTRGALTEIREYYANCWGTAMDLIKPTNPCVYQTTRNNSIPKLVHELK